MNTTQKAVTKPGAEIAVKAALEASPDATTESVASAAGVSQSTARKVLAQLVSAGEVARVKGGRDSGRRLPDRYSLQGITEKEPESPVSVRPSSREPAAELDAARENGESEVTARQAGPRKGSTMWAALEVLRDHGQPMSAAEIYAAIRERKLAPSLKGKTPEQTVAAQLAVHVKRGLYVERPEPGKFQLKHATSATSTGP